MSRLKNKLMIGYWESKRFINQCFQYILKAKIQIKQNVADTHRVFVDRNVYKNVGKELFDIVCNGFIIWLLMVGFAYVTGLWRFANPALIMPYGIIPWYSIMYYKEIKNNV